MTGAVAPTGPGPDDGLWSPRRRMLTTGLVLTITLVAFEALAVSTVMPEVADDLGGLGLYGWVFSTFFLGNLVGIVVAGRAADRRGTAGPFAAGLAVFAAGLVCGGLAPSMAVLVAARAVQGVGAGAIPAIAYTSVGQAYPSGLRPRVFAVFSSAWVVPGLVGPAASGAIEHAFGWRAVFLALLPFVVAAGAITFPQLTRRPTAAAVVRAGRDLSGHAATGAGWEPRNPQARALVLVGGVAALLVAAAGPPLTFAVPLGAVGVVVSAMALAGLVPPGTGRLAAGMPAAVAVRGVLTFAFFGTDAYVSLTFSEVRDRPTWVAGAALTAATVAWTFAAWMQERFVARVGPRRLVSAGFCLVVVGIAGMLGALGPAPVGLAIVVWSVAGFGIGLAYAPISVTVLALAEPGREGVASSSLQLCDVLGVALGTGLGGAFVALADSGAWALRQALVAQFALTGAVALAGAVAARRLPQVLPDAPAR